MCTVCPDIPALVLPGCWHNAALEVSSFGDQSREAEKCV